MVYLEKDSNVLLLKQKVNNNFDYLILIYKVIFLKNQHKD